ncbi:MAG TPA: hypothetical protein VKN99_26655 [Polyangia bacterium]|nr:hypothetical protein [Polyangia bacterium]
MVHLNLARMFDYVDQVIRSRGTVASGMKKIIGRCRRSAPDPDWKRFLEIDFASDVERLREWLTRVFASPPPADQTGLWFGLCTPVLEGGSVCDLRVHAAVYDSENAEWPCWLNWEPSEPYARSQALASIYRIAYRSERADYLGNNAEYPLCLGYAGLALRSVLSGVDPPRVVAGANQRVALLGWDGGGDQLYIGAVRKDGFRVAKTAHALEPLRAKPMIPTRPERAQRKKSGRRS